jgi:hypothetical protein
MPDNPIPRHQQNQNKATPAHRHLLRIPAAFFAAGEEERTVFGVYIIKVRRIEA